LNSDHAESGIAAAGGECAVTEDTVEPQDRRRRLVESTDTRIMRGSYRQEVLESGQGVAGWRGFMGFGGYTWSKEQGSRAAAGRAESVEPGRSENRACVQEGQAEGAVFFGRSETAESERPEMIAMLDDDQLESREEAIR